jgi:hypothetical protein
MNQRAQMPAEGIPLGVWLNTLGGFVSSKHEDNLLDGASTLVRTDIAQTVSVQGKAAPEEKAEKETKWNLIRQRSG